MSRVELSTVSYFTQGNMVLGSCTPDKCIADPLADIFNYRAKCVKAEDGTSSLFVEYYIGNKCYKLTDLDCVFSESFEMTQDGIDKAAAWLEERFAEYNKNC